MKQGGSSTVDVRSFRWPFATLERRRALAVDQAAVHLARAERERAAIAGQVERAEAEEGEQLEAIRKATLLDPVVRSQALAYLGRISVKAQAAHASLVHAEQRTGDARAELQRTQRDVDLLATLRGAALAAFIVEAGRRQAKEADLAWLARLRGSGAPR